MRKKIFPTVLLFMLTSCGVAGSNELEALNTENEAAMAEDESTLSLGNKKGKVKCGDLTGNGSISSLDASKIYRIEDGLDKLTADALAVGDVNFDGKLSKEDAYLVQKAVVGKIKSLQCPARNEAAMAEDEAAMAEDESTLSLGNKTGKVKCGDVSGDGRVSYADATVINRIVSGRIKLTEDALARGDVDFDGKLTNEDAAHVRKAVDYKTIMRMQCPARAAVYDTSSFKCGDVSGNGWVNSFDALVINRIASGRIKLTADFLQRGDVNFDGKLTEEDADLVQKAVVDKITWYLKCPSWRNEAAVAELYESTLSLGNKTGEVKCGDLTGNGSISSLDASKIYRIEDGLDKLTADALAVGDVNFDGKLSKEDAYLVQKAVFGKIKSLQCPARAAVYDNFNGTINQSDIIVNGSANKLANTTGNHVQLQLLATKHGWGSAWWDESVDLSKDWSSGFFVTAFNGNGASDGFTFAINGDPKGTSSLGDGGQNLGFFGHGNGGVKNSYAVLFDMWTTGPASLLGFSKSDSPTTIPSGSINLPISLANNSYAIQISYSASRKVLSTSIGGETYEQSVDLQSVVGNSGYLGFTAANGGGTLDTDISNWTANASKFGNTPVVLPK